MHVAAGFITNAYLEIAIEQVKLSHVSQKRITFFEMTPQDNPHTLFDSIHYSDGSSSMDGIAVGAVVGGVLGIIYGSKLWLGSLLLGLLAFVVGGVIGFLIDKSIGRHWKATQRIKHIDALLLIQCDTRMQADRIVDICRANHAVSIGIHS